MIIMTKNKSSLFRRILRFSLCTVLICSLIFITGCSRNDDNLIFRGGISDLIHGSSESGGGLNSLFSSLGAEYAEESDPLNAILDAVIVQFEANGYTDVKISSQQTAAAHNFIWGYDIYSLTSQISMKHSDSDSGLQLILGWNPETGMLCNVSWAIIDGYIDTDELLDILFSDSVLDGGSQIINNLTNNPGFYENKFMYTTTISGNLTIEPGPVLQDDNYIYTDLGGEAALLWINGGLPPILPVELGSLPVTHISIAGDITPSNYLGIPEGVRSVSGVGASSVLIFPSTVEDIDWSLFYYPGIEAVFVFNPDATLHYPENLNFVPEGFFYAPAVRVFTDSESVGRIAEFLPDIEVLTVDNLYAGFSEDMPGKEYMLEALENGDYTYIDEILETFGW